MTAGMDYFLHLAQAHETFRIPELEALAIHEGVGLDIVDYQPESPFCTIRIKQPDGSSKTEENAVKSLMSRSILGRGVYELWGQGSTYEALHQSVHERTSDLWQRYKYSSFKFTITSFYGKRSSAQQREIINSFRYLAFEGKISMKSPEVEFVVFEEWDGTNEVSHDVLQMKQLEEKGYKEGRQPRRLFFGRHVGGTSRRLGDKHDLKKRPYISTTSMDAELALVTATLALAAPGKLFLDPFVGTGGFMVAASELGALTFGSDIDGRSYRGKGPGLEKGVGANFVKYGLKSRFGDCFASDLTNTPLRCQSAKYKHGIRWLDGIIADPPYGIREGLKVLGSRPVKPPIFASVADNGDNLTDDQFDAVQLPYLIDGVPAHTRPGYIAPKKPYSFSRMLDDILDFAARTLVDKGRLAFWMPSANELDQELALPEHPFLELKHVCVQNFNHWSRRLLVYQRIKGDVDVAAETLLASEDLKKVVVGSSADDLNPFRKLYFNKFQTEQSHQC